MTPVTELPTKAPPSDLVFVLQITNNYIGIAIMADSEFSILTPIGMLGYGYNAEHFWYGIEEYRPEAIILDSGSTDGGPYKLGMNKLSCSRSAYTRDLEPMLAACFHFKIKVLISSVGGDGSDKHVQEMLDIVTEISNRLGFTFNIATINAGIDRGLVKRRIASSQVHPCGPVEDLLPDVVDGAVDVVAQMGAEPFMEALKGDPDIILAGRSYDPAPFASFCLSRGVTEGVAWHMGKIMECGGACAVPKGQSIIATIRRDSFDLTPLTPGIKLEGVTHLGYRTIFIGGIRDPILIGQIGDFLERVRSYVAKKQVPKTRAKMSSLARVIRSKNAGPFEITFDVMFDNQEVYDRVRDAHVLGNEVIRRLYRVEDEDIITNMFYEPALAWKCTIKRSWAQGSVGERDTLGTQQHAPLLNIEVPGLEAVTPTALDSKNRSDFLAF
ncbi:putative caib baif family enzyme [Diaporthe ampelina]|uniref:Putative caib baif family enzyme n=1 Tax=Diaporthe ampelina TaxID=1214573 RepID=A0A0G2HZ65_9PEZI|nr:putative caib baif family enzyme [Diaporthe ampelina]